VIDIHSHILPGVDDGPRTPDEALEVLAALASEGVQGVVATPHFNDQYTQLSAAEVQARVETLHGLAHDAGISMHLWAGHEIRLKADIEQALAQGSAATINGGPYVLVELPTQEFPVFLPELIGRLRVRGYVPVIAHAERYQPTWQDPTVLEPLVELGALMQITATSLVGTFGRRARHAAETLLTRNVAHVIASDCHALKDRPPNLAASLRAAESLVGRERLHELTVNVPRAIVLGKSVLIPPITNAKHARY
jgi:protein-tyrosine phosphatase